MSQKNKLHHTKSSDTSSHSKLPAYSLVVSYKNREIDRVKRFLDSLLWQTFQDFELVILDYGSEVGLQTSIQLLVQQYKFVRYFYTETRGHLWNQSQALNLAVSHTRGDKIVVLDADLIFAPDFMQSTDQMFSPDHFIRYKYYYLPESFQAYDKLFDGSFNPSSRFETTRETNFGLLTISKDVFFKVGGYEEFYRLWGLNDLDFVKRMKSAGVEAIAASAQIKVYHQWHAKVRNFLPKGWYSTMLKHYQSSNYSHSQVLQPTKMLTLNDRPALRFTLENGLNPPTNTFQFEYPKEQSYVKFSHLFERLASGEYILIHQQFELIKLPMKTKWSRVFHFLNRIFLKMGLSYRWVDLKSYYSEVISKEEIRDFLFYFIINNEEKLLDYYFDYQSKHNEIWCVMYKK